MFGVVGDFAFVIGSPIVVGSKSSDFWRLDLLQGSSGRWQKTTTTSPPAMLGIAVSHGFSLYVGGGEESLGYIGDRDFKYQLTASMNKIGACPKGCYVKPFNRLAPGGECAPCALGKTNAFDDQTGEASCIDCVAGRVGLTLGATECFSCKAGWSSSPPGFSCCNPVVTLFPKELSTPVVSKQTQVLTIYLIHGGPHEVTWKFKAALPSWIVADTTSGTLKGGETKEIELTLSNNDLDKLGTEAATLTVITAVEASSDNLYPCDGDKNEDGTAKIIQQERKVKVTIDRVVGPIHPTSCSLLKETGGTNLVNSIFEWTFTAKDEGGRRINTGGSTVTAKVGTVDATVKDNNDGTYTITHKPPTAGIFTLTLLVSGVNAKTISFTVERKTCGSNAQTVEPGDKCECVAGAYYKQADQKEVCVECGAGTYQTLAGQSSCTNCGIGKYGSVAGKTTEDVCVDCPRSRYGATAGLNSENSCSLCQAGKYGKSANVCEACLINSYNTDEGKEECKPCKLGEKFINTVTEPAECLAGTFGSAPGICTECPSNSFAEEDGRKTSCEVVAIGIRFVSKKIAAQPCDVGTYGSEAGICTPCGNNEYQTTKGSTSCKTAAIGMKYGSTMSEPVLCESGTFGSGPGICTPCGDNEYQTTKGQTECKKVVLGSKYISSTSEPVLCDAGTFGSAPGICSECQAGKYSEEGRECSECPVDTYLSEAGKTSSGDCQLCASTFAPHTTTAGETGVDTIEKCICAGADPTSSDPNGFYQIAPDLMTTEMIKEDPAQREICIPCPNGGDCSASDGLISTDIVALPGFWRSNLETKIFTDCSKAFSSSLTPKEDAITRCPGGNSNTNATNDLSQRRRRAATTSDIFNPDDQCKSNNTEKEAYGGPACMTCLNEEYTMRSDGKCSLCPDGASITGALGVVAGFMVCLSAIFAILFLKARYEDINNVNKSKNKKGCCGRTKPDQKNQKEKKKKSKEEQIESQKGTNAARRVVGDQVLIGRMQGGEGGGEGLAFRGDTQVVVDRIKVGLNLFLLITTWCYLLFLN